MVLGHVPAEVDRIAAGPRVDRIFVCGGGQPRVAQRFLIRRREFRRRDRNNVGWQRRGGGGGDWDRKFCGGTGWDNRDGLLRSSGRWGGAGGCEFRYGVGPKSYRNLDNGRRYQLQQHQHPYRVNDEGAAAATLDTKRQDRQGDRSQRVGQQDFEQGGHAARSALDSRVFASRRGGGWGGDVSRSGRFGPVRSALGGIDQLVQSCAIGRGKGGRFNQVQ